MQRSDFDTAAEYAEWARRAGIDLIDRQGRRRGFDGASGSLALACVPVRQSKPLRRTHHLTAREFWKTYRGVALANLNGEVMASMLTISWGSLGLSGAAAWEAHKRFTELFRKWRQARGLSQSWFWVRERGAKLGDHSHIVMNLSWEYGLQLVRWAEGAVETISGQAALRRSRVQRVQTVHLRSERLRQDAEVVRQWELFQYLFKGLAPDEDVSIPGNGPGSMNASDLIVRSPRRQGLVVGKRSGLSTELGPAALAGFLEDHPLAFAIREGRGQVAYDDRFMVHARIRKGLRRLGI